MSWNYQTKNLTNNSFLSRNSSTNNFQEKQDITIFLTSVDGDFYLVGQNEDLFLATKEGGAYSYVNKS